MPPRMSRSIPLAKAMDDALVCLYQNGERVRPSNGYPVRLLLPGFEGNMNVKWLRRLKLDRRPGDDQGRDLEIHDPAPGREGLAVRVPDGGQIGHHASVAGTHAEGAGLLRDFRPGLVGQRPHPAGRSLGRRRTKLGAGGVAGARPAEGARCASARRGNGTAARRCCKAAPPTRPAWCSRRARSSSPSAACAASITTTRSQAGASTRKGRRPMSMLERLAVCTMLIAAHRPPWRRAPQFGQPIAPADIAPGTSASAPTARAFRPAAARPRGRSGLCREMPGLPRRERRGPKPQRCARRRHGHARPGKPPVKTVGSYWPYATTLFDYIRRAMPFQEPNRSPTRGLCGVGLHPQSQRHHRRRRRARRAVARRQAYNFVQGTLPGAWLSSRSTLAAA